MKILDPFIFIATGSLARLAPPVPVHSHTVESALKHNGAVGSGSAVPLAESAFAIFAIPGVWETLRKFRSEQGDRELSSESVMGYHLSVSRPTSLPASPRACSTVWFGGSRAD